MLIYKQKRTDGTCKYYTEALKVGNIAWLHDAWIDVNTKAEEEAPSSTFFKVLGNCPDLHGDPNSYRLPTQEDIDALNIWIKDENNLQEFKNFYHIVTDDDNSDKFWVDGVLKKIATFKDGQLITEYAINEGIEDKEHKILVFNSVQACGHIVVAADELEAA
jgi:hypothetical protein